MPAAQNHKERALAALNALAYALTLSRGHRMRLIREEGAAFAGNKDKETHDLRLELAQAHAHQSTLQQLHSDYARAIATGLPDTMDDLGELIQGAITAIRDSEAAREASRDQFWSKQ